MCDDFSLEEIRCIYNETLEMVRTSLPVTLGLVIAFACSSFFEDPLIIFGGIRGLCFIKNTLFCLVGISSVLLVSSVGLLNESYRSFRRIMIEQQNKDT